MKKILFALLLTTLSPIVLVHADATSTPEVIVATSTPETVSFAIRNDTTILGPWTFTLPDASSSPISITPTSGTTTPIELSARSVLGVLGSLDAEKDDFSISDLKYFDFGQPYAGGLYLNCLIIPAATATPACDDWQYSINGAAPWQGAGVTELSDGDAIFLYYGTPRHVTLSTTTTQAGTPFTATAEGYDPSTNTWSSATAITIGVTQPDPSNPWSPLEIATSPVDVAGQAIFTLSATGTFQVGIKEDYYSPTTDITVIDIIVVATSSDDTATSTATSTPPTTEPPAPSGGGGGGGGYTHTQIDVAKAITYLVSQQQPDGSFGAPIYSDWAALAFAAIDPGAAKLKLRNYLTSGSPTLVSITDYERHAMALMALGIDPYTGTPTDYIAYIVGSFDGTQIGEASLDNDDIFAIFPLLRAGYTVDDLIIQKAVAFIVSSQNTDGSWNAIIGAPTGDVDTTSAAIQALALTPSLPGVSDALAHAKTYLHSQQQTNGGFYNDMSTSWALQAIMALGESPSTWAPVVYDPRDYLASFQQTDGGIGPVSNSSSLRIWATEFAIPAALGKTWHTLLQSFSKPATTNSGNVGGSSASSATSTPLIATSTIPLIATSTLPVATSTAPIIPTSTSTIPTIPLVLGTSTVSTSTAPEKPAKKIVNRPRSSPASTTSATTTKKAQAAAAANSDSANIISRFWRTIFSFFIKIM